MVKIECRGKKIEACLKQYRQKLERIGQLDELKERKTFEKPSVRRRKTKLVAKYRTRKDGSV